MQVARYFLLGLVATVGCGGSSSGSRLDKGAGTAAPVADAGGDSDSDSIGDDPALPTTADVSATVDLAHPEQTLVGFGAAVAFYVNWLSPRGGDGDDVYKVLFPDLGLDILRIGNWYQNQGSNTSETSPLGDTDGLAVVQKATAALGHAPIVLMSSWSPPAYLKSNNATRGTEGTLIQANGGYAYADFGDWWRRALEAYAAQGVHVDFVSIQNEPDYFNSGWESCDFDANEGGHAGYGPALDAAYLAVSSSSVLTQKPQFIGPETSGIAGNRVENYMAGLNASHLDVIAHHLYNGSDSATGPSADDPPPDSYRGFMGRVAGDVAAYNKPIFQTEYSPNEPSLLNTAWLIHDSLTIEKVSAYLYWALAWAPPQPDSVPTGLVTLSAPNASRSYTVNDTYYAVRHFSKWTDPGWVRIDASSSASAVKVSAFVSPDGASLTVVLINTDQVPHGVALSLGGFAFTTAAAYRSTAGSAERTAELALGDGNVVAMPATSIVTAVFSP